MGRISLAVRRAVLRILRPAESAARRLIFLAAQGLAVKQGASRSLPPAGLIRKSGASRSSAFQLFDPRKNFTTRSGRGSAARGVPRISVVDHDPRISALWAGVHPPSPATALAADGLADAAPLRRRLQALKAALEDVPRQARRLVRWQERRKKLQGLRPTFISALRPGLPPGYRRSPAHEVDEVLIDCHGLALDVIRRDTS